MGGEYDIFFGIDYPIHENFSLSTPGINGMMALRT
jgi:hypothetical protein